jgi:galactose mutarotase-like enzyme
MRIEEAVYKDVGAVAMESGRLRVILLPAYGGKMASLVDKKTGREFLVQAPDDRYKKLDYAGNYVDAECSGFDDMFPTIDTWEYEKHPWRGAVMPDHGEVCGLPWKYEAEGEGLHCWVYGVRFPYRLDKWLQFETDETLTIRYRVLNLSPFDLDYIWAAHMMINAEPDARILLPYDDGAGAVCVFSHDNAFASPGMAVNWPKTTTAAGEIVDISRARKLGNNTYKYYFNDPMPDGSCAYAYSDGTALCVDVSKEVPYLGVWINEGAFKGYNNIALEPCSGTFDDPGKAVAHCQNSVLPSNGTCEWQLRLYVEGN